MKNITTLRVCLSLALLTIICVSGLGVDPDTGNPRVAIPTDIGNEHDDQMSLVRFLLHSNEIDAEALTGTTSASQRDQLNPQTIWAIIAGLADVRPRLLAHATAWSSAEPPLTRYSRIIITVHNQP